MVQGGVNFEPYKAKLFESIGRKVDCIELFPASEGFFAFQDSQKAEGLLLNTNSGIFFEFVPAAEIFNENPTRLILERCKSRRELCDDHQQQCRFVGHIISGIPLNLFPPDPYRISRYRQNQTFYFCLWRTCDW